MGIISKSIAYGTDSRGYSWTVTTVRYNSTTGNSGDYDVVIQISMEGIERGHTTYHYAADGTLKQTNVTGNVTIPNDVQLIPC